MYGFLGRFVDQYRADGAVFGSDADCGSLRLAVGFRIAAFAVNPLAV